MSPSDFWNHTLAVYRRPGVSAACLGLQGRRGADVNILLYALWRAATGGGALDAAALAGADAAVGPWRVGVVERLRATREAIKSGIAGVPAEAAEALRKAILGHEIEGERIAHLMLAALPAGSPPGSPAGPTTAAASLLAYARFLGFTPNDQDRADLRALVAAAFPDVVLDRALIP